MSELDGVKMRVIALDELMKCCAEIGRTSDSQEHKELARALFEVARTRHDFLSASRSADENHKG
jgi:predicted nucleotidyltransferase